jgi:hypothetical protein
MSRTAHHGSKGQPSNTCPSGRKCPTCAENRRHSGEKDSKEAKLKQLEQEDENADDRTDG